MKGMVIAMDITVTEEKNGWLRANGLEDFSVFRTFDCGQCFRFSPVKNPEYNNEISGVAFGKTVSFAEDKNGLLIRSSLNDFEKIWKNYLSLDIDYKAINNSLLSCITGADADYFSRAIRLSRGIRILRQDRWEALCSFIISQNNNIPRIKKIIREMSEKFGEKIDDDNYAFPTAKSLADAGENAIFALKTGFRAKYITDAAKKIADGEIDLDKVADSASYADAENILLKIKGVGAKVAACTLLFGFGRLDAFPIDVWIKRVIEKRFTTDFSPEIFGKYAGIAQQYMFYCERYIDKGE